MIRVVVLALILAFAGVSLARSEPDDHERARAAFERGEILPLSEILALANEEIPGRVIDVEFDRDDGRYIYELELLDETGQLWELELDAATGAILDSEAEEDDD